MQRSKLWAAALLAGAFAFGAVLGAGTDRVLRVREAEAATSYDGFASELALTAAQRAGVDSVLDAGHAAIDAILRPLQPRVEAVRAETQRAIASRLTPAQQARYARYLERRRAETGGAGQHP